MWNSQEPGLILGTNGALKNGGPGSLLIAYIIMGFVVYVVMVALGEMGAWLPHKKHFPGYASRFVDPAMGYDEDSPEPFSPIPVFDAVTLAAQPNQRSSLTRRQLRDRLELLLQIRYCVAQQLNRHRHLAAILAPRHQRVGVDRRLWHMHRRSQRASSRPELPRPFD